MDRFFKAFLFLTCLFTGIFSFLIEELMPVHYEVELLKTPVKKGEKHSQPSVIMKTKFGQEYQCWLPVVEDDESSKKENIDSDKNIDIKELLQPIQSGSCLLKVQDWWTYELCPGLYIKQFHIEDGHILGPVITLGIYESDYDWTNETNQEKFKHATQPYHSQWYVNGTKCDLTGQPRNAEIRMFCEPDAGDYIYRVDEHETCNYLITIHTSRICSYPPLKPVPAKKAHTIPCRPVLSEEQYNKYTQKVNEQQMLVDQKRSQWLNNQQERLQVMKKENLQQMENEKNLKSREVDDKFPEKEVVGKVESPLKESTENAEEEVDTVLIQEYSRKMEILKSFLSPEQFLTVKESIQTHYRALLLDAETDENPALSEKAREAYYRKLETTINILQKKWDQAENDAKAAQGRSKEQSNFSKHISDEELDKIIKESKDISKITIRSRDEELVEGGIYNIPAIDDQKQVSIPHEEELLVRVRTLDRRSPGENPKLYEMNHSQRKKLEDDFKEKFEKSSHNTGGRKIKVEITAGFYNNEQGKDFPILTDETYQMIMALLVGQQEEIEEMEKHKNLEKSYKFNWEREEENDD